MSKVFIGVGHGGRDPGAVANGLKESHLNLTAALACSNYLAAYNIKVLLSRYKEEDDPIDQEVKECNAFNPDLAVDLHTNSGGGDGFEIYHYSKGGLSKTFAANIESEVKSIGQNSRGLKTKIGKDGKDYFTFIKDVKAPSVIAEMAFIDNTNDIKDFDQSAELTAYGEAIARGVLLTLGITIKENISGTPIIYHPTATIKQCQAWAKSKNATQTFIKNLSSYFNQCSIVGVNPVVSIAQYAKETGYGKFGGVLTEEFNNPCGLKVPQGGDCKDPEAHKKFNSWDDGISAHIDHLSLYAGVSGYPKANSLDPRHFTYLLGKCKTVESLSGNWAPMNTYGSDLVIMIKEIELIKVEDELSAAAKVLHDEGIINTLAAWNTKEEIKVDHVPQLIINMAKYIDGRL